MIPIDKLLGYDPAENAAMVRNLNAQAARRVQQCPPCTGTCEQGRRCTARLLRTGNGGEHVDTRHPSAGQQSADPGSDPLDRALTASLHLIGWAICVAAVVLVACIAAWAWQAAAK